MHAESAPARQPMPAWRLSQDGVERIRKSMYKFNQDQDLKRAQAEEAAAAERRRNLSVSTNVSIKAIGQNLDRSVVERVLPPYEAKLSADLEMLHTLGEEVAALVKPENWAGKESSLTGNAAGDGRNGADPIYPTISTRKAAGNRRFHRESPSWEVDPGHDSFFFVRRPDAVKNAV